MKTTLNKSGQQLSRPKPAPQKASPTSQTPAPASKTGEKYRELFLHVNDAIIIFEPESETVLEVNDKACEIYDLPRDRFVGCSLKTLTEDIGKGEECLKALLNTGTCQSYETVNFRSDGTPIEFLVNASVINYDGVTAIMSINRDITERKLIRRELERNLSLLTSTFEATADGVLALDLENRIVTANRKFIDMFRLDVELGDISEFSTMVLADIESALKQPTSLLGVSDLSSFQLLHLKDGRTLERYTQVQDLEGRIAGRVMTFRDVTERIKTEATLRESESRYRLLFNRNPYPIWVYDTQTLRFLAVNEEAVRQYGFSEAEFLRLTIKDIRPREQVPELMEFLASNRASEEIVRTVTHQRKDGSTVEVEATAQSIIFAGRRARIVLITDLTERNFVDAALRESETRMRTLLDSMSEGLLQVDGDDIIRYLNNSICEMTGYSQKELIGTKWSRLLVDEGPEFVASVKERRLQGVADRYEIQIRKKSGDMTWVSIGGAPVMDANSKVIGSMGVFTDISEKKGAEERLRHDALHDGLTGLANRNLFMDHLRLAIERSRSRTRRPFAVLYLDFDRFKVINDSLGHAEGDRLLQFIARRLENCVRSGDLVARLGGDEFVILVTDLVDTGEALLVAERIQNDLKLSFNLTGREIYTTTSIGIALSTAGHTNADDMLRDADIAMYYAKEKGKAQYQIFDQAMHTTASRKLQIETELRSAFVKGDFKLFYQPIVRLTTGELVGFEALLRWDHRDKGIVGPDEFIPIAEENGMILKLGAWAVMEACRQLKDWHDTLPAAAELTMNVNLSSKEFLQLDLAERIASTLKTVDLLPRFLNLEITESHIMENSELAITVLDRLRELGVEMSLDDFGTGYSSLSYLHNLPVNQLKIDRSFVTKIGDDAVSREILQTIIHLAQITNKKVVAEGVESLDQLSGLTELQCEYGQGYLFSPPLDAESARQFISEQQAQHAVLNSPPVADKPNLVM